MSSDVFGSKPRCSLEGLIFVSIAPSHAVTDSPFVTTVEGKNLAPPSHAYSLNQDHTLPLNPPGINIVVSEKKDDQSKIKNVLVAVDGIDFTILKPGGSGGMLGALERRCESGARFFPSTV